MASEFPKVGRSFAERKKHPRSEGDVTMKGANGPFVRKLRESDMLRFLLHRGSATRRLRPLELKLVCRQKARLVD